MSSEPWPKPDVCHCLAVRQAARHVTQFYDQFLASVGLRTSQFSILARLRRLGPLTINALARDMVMDRTTLGRNILPLEREGLISIVRGSADRRSKELKLTEQGLARLTEALAGWSEAQLRFESAFGQERALELRGLLQAVAASDLPVAAAPAAELGE
jgi:DNA-binding MarR family transcriptional regulator